MPELLDGFDLKKNNNWYLMECRMKIYPEVTVITNYVNTKRASLQEKNIENLNFEQQNVWKPDHFWSI